MQRRYAVRMTWSLLAAALCGANDRQAICSGRARSANDLQALCSEDLQRPCVMQVTSRLFEAALRSASDRGYLQRFNAVQMTSKLFAAAVRGANALEAFCSGPTRCN